MKRGIVVGLHHEDAWYCADDPYFGCGSVVNVEEESVPGFFSASKISITGMAMSPFQFFAAKVVIIP